MEKIVTNKSNSKGEKIENVFIVRVLPKFRKDIHTYDT